MPEIASIRHRFGLRRIQPRYALDSGIRSSRCQPLRVAAVQATLPMASTAEESRRMQVNIEYCGQ
jgi:hypothetical protein